MKLVCFFLSIFCLEIYLRYSFRHGKIIKVVNPDRFANSTATMKKLEGGPPTKPFENLPQLPGPIFWKTVKNRLEGGQENQLYFTKTDQFVVVDRFSFLGYEPLVTRSLAMVKFKHGVHSVAILKVPKGRSYHDTDTRYWEVDKTAIAWGDYEYMLLDSIFSSGAVRRRNTEKAKFLGIGLGGSAFNNYFSHVMPNFNITMVELDPVMEQISLDWFDLQLNDNHRVVIEDGIQFMAREAKQRKRYDILLLDATHSQDFHFTIAPVSAFYENDTLRNMAKLIGPRGILISNLLFGRQYNPKIGSAIIANKFRRYFRHVEIRRVPRKRNHVLIARQLPIHYIGRRRVLY